MKQIGYHEARELAEKAATENLKQFAISPNQPILRAEFLEAENCWFFFRNPDIIVPPESSLSGDMAYAVSRDGKLNEIADLYADPKRLNAYLKTMSDYFGQKGK